MRYCPRCLRLVMTTPHNSYDAKGKLARQEMVCNICHSTIEVKYFEKTVNKAKYE